MSSPAHPSGATVAGARAVVGTISEEEIAGYDDSKHAGDGGTHQRLWVMGLPNQNGEMGGRKDMVSKFSLP